MKPTEIRLEIVRELAAQELHITPEHALLAAVLPVVHRDPFDRMLVAQAQFEGLTLVTADAQVRLYGGNQLWVGR